MRSLLRPLAAIAAFAVLASSAAAAPKATHERPYGRGQAVYHPTPIPPYQITSEEVKLSFEFERDFVRGVASMTVLDTARAAQLPFNSVGLAYDRVELDGKPATYALKDDHLVVDAPPNPSATTPLQIVAHYHTVPVRGIYFIHPNAAYPDRIPQIWSQGETEDTRRWMPTWDEPNMKFTTSVAASVPSDWTMISNGSRVSDVASGDGKTHVITWREARAHSSYLTSFVAGPYVRTHDTLGALDVDYYTSPADAPLARQCFGRTPDMIAFFQTFTGTTYPWEKYAQTTVDEFTAGGMENVSATTQTQFAIHPAAFELESPCDGLVSHELAHQWFGDDVTTKDWPNIWVNEGFATYFQELWSQHHFGEDAFALERVRAQDAYFRETKRYWRPIVEYTYGTAQDSFDSSGYPRPAQGLHMLRTLLGDAAFRAGIKAYLAAHAYTNTDTEVFEHSMEAASGRDLRWFFREWYHTASYPNYVVRDSYDAATKTLTLAIAQKNHAGTIFRMPVTIAAYVGGQPITKLFDINAARQTITLAGVTRAPNMVLFDVGNSVVRTLDYSKSVAQLGYQATHATSVADRVWAERQLGRVKKSDRAAARAALRPVVLRDAFYGVRVDALDAAAGLDDADTVRLALADPDPRVTIAAARATSSLDHQTAALTAALKALLANPDVEIRAAAYAGYGATKTTDAKAALVAALAVHKPQDIVARGALDGLGDLGDITTLDAVLLRSTYGYPLRTRVAAIAALGKLAKQKAVADRIVSQLEDLATSDPYFGARRAAVGALGKAGRKDAIATLEHIRSTDPEESLQSGAYDAIADINDPPSKK